MEASGDFGEGVSARGGAWELWGRGMQGHFLFFQVPWSHLFTDGGLQQAVGGNGAIPQQPIETGLHWAHHPLKQTSLITLHLRMDQRVHLSRNSRESRAEAVSRLHDHLWARGIGRAPASLVPSAALPVQLLAAVLLHSFQEKVVDGREVIVAAALERLHGPLPVDSQRLHDAKHGLTVVTQVGVVVAERVCERLVGGDGVSQHPPVLLDLSYGDALGRVNHQHLPDQILTVF